MFLTKKKKLTVFVAIILAMSLLAACGNGDGVGGDAVGGGGGDGPIVMRLASNAPVGHMSHDINLEVVRLVYERTEGRVRIDYFPGGQLGDYTTVYEEVMMGVIDFMHGTVPDTIDPRLGVPYMPYYSLGFEDVYELYGEGSLLYNLMYEATEAQRVEFLGFVIEGFIGLGAVATPDNELIPGAPKNVNMRVPGALVALVYPMQDLGFHTVGIPFAEAAAAIHAGVVDGWNGGTPNMNYLWVGDIITTMYVNYMHVECTAFVGSRIALDRLDPVDRDIVTGVFREMSKASFGIAEANERYFIGRLEAAGVRVVEFTYEERMEHAAFIREVTWPRLAQVFTEELVEQLRVEAARVQGGL